MSHKKYRQETNCLNCGAEVKGKFCPDCGQENLEIHENFLHIAAHTVADFFHYDSKFFKSLKFLVIHPGWLTKEYLGGRRVRYVHPLRLFFFVTIVMVIIASLYYKKYEREIKSKQITISKEGSQKKISAVDLNTVNSKDRELLQGITHAFDNVSYYLKYISFFLLPVYALGFKLLYIRRKHFYVDHLIYTMHLQTFAYIILTLLLLIPLYITSSAREWFNTVLVSITFVYMIISLHYLYRQSWFKTILKAILATTFMIIVTVLLVAGFIGVAILRSKLKS